MVTSQPDPADADLPVGRFPIHQSLNLNQSVWCVCNLRGGKRRGNRKGVAHGKASAPCEIQGYGTCVGRSSSFSLAKARSAIGQWIMSVELATVKGDSVGRRLDAFWGSGWVAGRGPGNHYGADTRRPELE